MFCCGLFVFFSVTLRRNITEVPRPIAVKLSHYDWKCWYLDIVGPKCAVATGRAISEI